MSIPLTRTEATTQEHFQGTLQLKKMTGDGNCLFHALGDRDRDDAVSLRNEIITYLEEAAKDQEEEQEEAWLDEATYLQNDPNAWGGDTAIVAFTLMRRQRVMLHWRTEDGRIHTDERTHLNIAEDLQAEGQEVIHLWYNGRDHYDLLLSSQAAPPTASPAGPSIRATPTPPPPAPHPEPRPPKRSKTAAQEPQASQAKASRPSPAPFNSAAAAADAAAATVAAAAVAAAEATVPAEPSLLEELSSIPIATQNTHPRRNLEEAVKHLAKMHLREQPLVPPGASIANVDTGEAWPQVFCAFESCKWSSPTLGTQSELYQHIREAHAAELRLVAQHMPKPAPQDALESIYNEAVAVRCREDAPVAGCSRDRAALRSFANATSQDKVESLICFSCACIHPHIEGAEKGNRIRWRTLIQPKENPEEEVHAEPTVALHQLLSLEEFLRRYDDLGNNTRLSEMTNFDDWTVNIPGLGKLLCCPEDHRCPAHPEHPAQRTLCEDCEVPLCTDCLEHLSKAELPPLSLCNDMWTNFSPERLHTHKVTVMEMICASPCVTTLVCMSMEARHRSEGTTLDEQAHCARHRLGARGNALTFPLPWEDLLQQLQAHDAQAARAGGGQEENRGEDAENAEEAAAALQLPRAGDSLGGIVRVLLKTNKTGKTTDAEIKTLLHQATVRRDVVVQLILDMKRLGHPSFQQLQEGAVRAAAARLPEDGVPPEVLKVINSLTEEEETGHKLQPQKAATPTDGREEDLRRAGDIFSKQRARAVIPEGCSQDREDQNAVAVAALNDLETQLRSKNKKVHETLEVRTGNTLVDQFQPLYFATAFCFCFKHGTACPDVQNTAAAARRNEEQHAGRRKILNPEAPEVGIHAWAAAMQRRAETQFRRDWTFGFTLWNYLFRTMVNTQQNAFMYSVAEDDSNRQRRLTSQEILDGLRDIQRELHRGQYRDINNEVKAVKGDLGKVRFVPRLSDAALKVGFVQT